jgi:cell division protein FtsZ
MINVDFEDLRTVMTERGVAMMGVGHATGEARAVKAAEKAIANPLLEDISVSGARGLLVNITSGLDFTLGEFNEVGDVIDQVASEDAKVIIGTSIDESMNDEIRVTVVATGLCEVAEAKRPEVVKPNLQAVEASKAEEKQEVERHAAPKAETAPEVSKSPETVRPKMVVNGGVTGSVDSSSNYLDIPAFLRRQVD